MTLGERVIDHLVDNGIDTVFAIPGKQTPPLNEAIDGRDDIRFGSGGRGPMKIG
jgi:acetolactate synthase-1/2/3 large subunit